jgi:tRNA(fMet)-specific endonuclease VapC
VTTLYLLDTGVVSSPISKVPSPEIVKRLEAHGHECAIAAPVWHELVYGCERMPEGRRRDAVQKYIQDVVRTSFPILSYDELAADWHGRERARLDDLGKPAPYTDAQIAAIAAVNDLTLITLNVKDFSRYKDLRIEDWSKRRS